MKTLNDKDIIKSSYNIVCFPYPGLEMFTNLMSYNSCRQDLNGGILDENWDLVFISIKDMLFFGINAFLQSKGYNPSKSNYQQLSLLADALGENSDLFKESLELTLVNVNSKAESEDLVRRCIKLIEDEFFTKDFIAVLWHDNVIDFSNWMNSLIQIQKLAEYLGINNIHTSIPIPSEYFVIGNDLTNRVFLRDE